MHGRLKVRSTAEQAAARKKERQEKVKVYREVTSRIYEKRSAGDLDDEALKLTKDVLSLNPEISTFWSYRREILEEKKKSLSTEEFTTLCGDELYLLETCLRVNPKSYGIWLHRQWIMTTSPQPDWKNEKRLCDLYLNYDERNFHCWDYRRFVISHFPEITPKDEFDFTYEKIAANFSNYSAWHYRSKLLPQLHPATDKQGGVAEEALLKEYELVQNAVFTDPNDQSAWFYHRWLLGKVEKPEALACVYVTKSPSPALYVTFNQPVKVSETRPIHVSIGKSVIKCSSESSWPGAFYECSIPSDLVSTSDDETDIKVTFDTLEKSLSLKRDESESWWVCGVEEMFGSSMTAATSTVLQTELDNCQELLQMEPNNKWCVLTTLLLMQALDAHTYADQITSKFKQLCSIDPYRNGYYSDLLSKFTIEQTLKSLLQDISKCDRTLNLSKRDLSKLCFTEHMVLFTSIDLSGNQLLALPPEVGHLSSVSTLVLDDNQLDQLPSEMKQLTKLKILSLRNNNITDHKCLESVHHIKILHLHGNPICELLGATLEKRLLEILPQLTELDGKTVTT